VVTNQTRDRPSLPPFSDVPGACPKCGKTGVTAAWHRFGGELGSNKGFPCYHIFRKEHMCRRCPTCGYGWMEATADAADAQGQLAAALNA
jgi:ssDNA-binding Zn-finger/Zn-ribbon topoisomerase 1